MQHPYIKYEQDKTWTVVNDLINDLINNNDIELQTPIEYVVGYICPQFRSIIPCEVLLYIEVTFLGFIH